MKKIETTAQVTAAKNVHTNLAAAVLTKRVKPKISMNPNDLSAVEVPIASSGRFIEGSYVALRSPQLITGAEEIAKFLASVPKMKFPAKVLKGAQSLKVYTVWMKIRAADTAKEDSLGHLVVNLDTKAIGFDYKNEGNSYVI